MNFVRFSILYFCGMNGSIKQYEWFKRLNDRQVNELIGLIDDWPIIDTEPIDSNVWLDRERWTNIDFVMIFVSGTVAFNIPALMIIWLIHLNCAKKNSINLYIFENISSRRMQRYQTLRDSTKLKFWWCHFRFSLNSLFGRTLHYPNIYAFPNLY